MLAVSLLPEGSDMPFTRKVFAGLTGDRTGVNSFIATTCEQLTREHVRGQVSSRHRTAEKLGARPTGHLLRAAESIDSSANHQGAEVSWPRNTGLQRAFRPLIIRPKKPDGFLTIPIDAASYGRRAREFDDLFVAVGRRGGLVLARLNGQDIQFLYLLVRKSVVPQDRDLLPSGDQYRRAAEVGVREWIKEKRREVRSGQN